MVLIDWVRKKVMHVKVYITRFTGYYQIGSGLLLVYLTLSDLVEKGVISNLKLCAAIILPLILLLVITLGYLDVKYGFFKVEQTKIYSNVPQIQETYEAVKRIEQKLENFK